MGDSVYRSLVKMDTGVIERLIELLPDTCLTQVQNTCDKTDFTVGQLAVLLIEDIEAIPWHMVTGIQFDDLDCGGVPHGLLEYVQNHGPEFQRMYGTYYHSKDRQDRVNKTVRKKG